MLGLQVEQDLWQSVEPFLLPLWQRTLHWSMRVGFSDSGPTLYLVSPWWNRLYSVLFGPWRTGLALPWTRYRVGTMSDNPTLVLESKELCSLANCAFGLANESLLLLRRPRNELRIISPPLSYLNLSREGNLLQGRWYSSYFLCFLPLHDITGHSVSEG